MARPEHVKIVKDGPAAIREWRVENPVRVMNLRDADLSGANLYGAYLALTNFSRANLSNAELRFADLYRVDLSGTSVQASMM
jgi:uncharacterized protein YjbI with pentapeptide repeats